MAFPLTSALLEQKLSQVRFSPKSQNVSSGLVVSGGPNMKCQAPYKWK